MKQEDASMKNKEVPLFNRYARLMISIMSMVILLTQLIFAKTNAASFLKIKASAKQVAMGGVSCGFSDDISCLETNPAGLAHLGYDEGNQLMLAHNEWFEGIRSEYAGYAHHVGERSVLTSSLKYVFMDDMIRRNDVGTEQGTFGANYGAITAGLAHEFDGFWLGLTQVEHFAVGVQAKGITESIDDKRAMSYAMDAGVFYRGEIIRLGASIQNLGTTMKLNIDEFALPTTMTVGGSIGLFETSRVGVDVEQELGHSMMIRSGGEYCLGKNIALRGGYAYTTEKRADSGISAGLGWKIGCMTIDYAFVPFGDLGDTHRMSLSFAWGRFLE